MSIAHDQAAIARLGAKIKSWGGELIRVTISEFGHLFHGQNHLTHRMDDFISHADTTGYYASPFDDYSGIHWNNRQVFHAEDNISPLIHEAGHLFASADRPWGPNETEEHIWLGWEIALARELKAYRAWNRGNGNYAVSYDAASGKNYYDWEQLKGSDKRDYIEERIAEATEVGLIVDGRAVSMRDRVSNKSAASA